MKSHSADWKEVLNLAVIEVEKASRAGGIIYVSVVAQRLLDQHPRCAMPFLELRNTLARLAQNRGLIVNSGDDS